MSPEVFWDSLFRSLYQFVYGIGNILRNVFNIVRNNELLLLYFGFMILGFSIYVFVRLINNG